ncbi:MAG: hypothetical protein ACD_11C00036G0003 [uncultured bacterium]|nr:MAG: hypothetical protein ACD_11C00036G0003 [uncultured bacterium]
MTLYAEFCIIHYMSGAAIQKKVLGLQAEIELIKTTLKKEPDFSIDERIWRKMRPRVKRERAKLYQSSYGKR